MNRFLFGALILSVCTSTLGTMAGTTSQDTPTVFVFKSFPDAFLGKNGKYEGTSIEITDALEDGLGLKLNTVVTSWPRIMGSVGTDHFDITYLFKLKTIADKVHFVGRLGCLADLVVPKKGLKISSLEDLKGYRVAMLRNAAFDKATHQMDHFSKTRTIDSDSMIKLLVRDRVDAIAIHSGHFSRLLKSKEPRSLFPENWRENLGEPFVRQLYEVQVTLSRKSKFLHLKDRLSKTVGRMEKSGVFANVMNKWGMTYWPCGE